MDKIIKIFKAEIKSIDQEKKRAVVVISTDKKDRDGDVILPDSFKKNLKSYKAHPILLSSHNYYDLMKQIGMAHSVKIGDKDVEADFEWFTDSGNPEADWGWFLATKGIAAFSIGFQGLEYEWIEEKDSDGNKRITGRKFTDIELLEVSQVLVPANAGALQNFINDARLPVEAKEMAELVLKGAKDWKLNFEDFDGKKIKKDDNQTISAHETRIMSLEKCYGEMKSAHDEMCQRMSDLESKMAAIKPEEEITPGINDGKQHYSRELLGADGKGHKQTPYKTDAATEATVIAIKEAFK